MASIAYKYGFAWETLWSLGDNAKLVANRQNPNVLKAGDRVVIPDLRIKEESGETALLHKFRLKDVPARLNLILKDVHGDPRAGVRYKLSVDGADFSGVTDSDGSISESIPPTGKKAILRLDGAETYELNLGYLDPPEYPSGLQARLKNLGFYKGAISSQIDDDTRAAVRTFQAAAGIPVTGEADSATAHALIARHGS
jgi:hypothetical protein